LWWAISDGQPLPDERWYPAGSMICYREWYGVKKDSDGLTIDNVGLSLENTRIAHGIKLREADGEVIKDSVADPSMWNFQGGPTIAEQFMTAKGAEIMFRKADNNRRAGWAQLKSRMTGTDFAMIYFFETCIHCLRTIPVLQGDQHDPEDLDTAGEDHAADAVRYACMARPIITRPTLELPMRGLPQLTMGELWRDHDKQVKEREQL
jgi:hypothetical protein